MNGPSSAPAQRSFTALASLIRPRSVDGVGRAQGCREPQDLRKEYDFSRARRGPVRPLAPGKTRITIRLDDDVIAWFKAQVHAAGGG